MPDSLPTRFSNAQLLKIIDEAMIYMCACPAQVAKQVRELRELYAYQHNCISRASPGLEGVHERIAEATRAAHAEMERCLDEVLDLEGWDRTTLAMPAGLRAVRDHIIENE